MAQPFEGIPETGTRKGEQIQDNNGVDDHDIINTDIADEHEH